MNICLEGVLPSRDGVGDRSEVYYTRDVFHDDDRYNSYLNYIRYTFRCSGVITAN